MKSHCNHLTQLNNQILKFIAINLMPDFWREKMYWTRQTKSCCVHTTHRLVFSSFQINNEMKRARDEFLLRMLTTHYSNTQNKFNAWLSLKLRTNRMPRIARICTRNIGLVHAVSQAWTLFSANNFMHAYCFRWNLQGGDGKKLEYKICYRSVVKPNNHFFFLMK